MVSSRTMPKAAIASVQLARFDRLREPGPAPNGRASGTVFCNVAADTRAAGTEPASQQAFTFLILGLHEDAASAQRFLADRVAWLDEAQEVWSGILEPFRHHGAANYLNRADPALLFESMMPADLADGPVVALTTSGWNVGEGLDMNRVREFGAGVLAVRASMTGVPGLRSQQSFFFPGVLECDPITVTFWRDEASIRAFAYGQGSHRRQLDRHRAEGLADRTSFTRFHVLSSAGTWYGVDPAARTADTQD
jgi:heme-degrading monooxygenase HmoA